MTSLEPGAEEAAVQPADTKPVDQPVIEPGDAPGRLTVIAVDTAEQPLPGACFAVVELGFEACDDDSDGAIVFDAVPSAPLTLRETVPPPGFASVGELSISIEPTGARLLVPHQPAGGEDARPVEPVETPQDAAGEGEVVLTLRDREGNPVPGACWALTEPDGNQTIERCDGEDGADDGVIHFDTVPAGRYRLHEVTTPTGYQPADDQGIDVVAGAPAEVTVEYQQARGKAGRLIILVADEDGNPVPQTCFDVRGPVELSEVCDRQDDGRLNVPDLPAGEYTVAQTQTADGFTPAAETSVVVPEDNTIELPLVNARAKTGEPAEGEQVAPVDEGRSPSTPGESCASSRRVCGAGRWLFRHLRLRRRGGGRKRHPRTDRNRRGRAGQLHPDRDAARRFRRAISGHRPCHTWTQRADRHRPLRGRDRAGERSLAIVAEELEDGANRLPGSCYTVEIPPEGQAFGPFCDEDGDGEVTVQGVTPGPVAVMESTPPPDIEPAEPARQEVDVVAGEETKVTFRHSPAADKRTAR